MTTQRSAVISARHQLPQLMAHTPRALVRDADLALKLFGGDAVAGAGHQVHRKEPMRQLGPRLVEDRVSGRIDVMAALLAGISATLRHRMEIRPNAAGRTGEDRAAVVDLHELCEARRVIGILGLKFLERVLGHSGHSPCGCGIP